jgi:hypothetical protein
VVSAWDDAAAATGEGATTASVLKDAQATIKEVRATAARAEAGSQKKLLVLSSGTGKPE